MQPTPLVELRNISKRFPGVQALDNVSLSVLPGEIHALIGENGAGKSTLMNILAGELQPDAGTIAFEGVPRTIANPFVSQSAGNQCRLPGAGALSEPDDCGEHWSQPRCGQAGHCAAQPATVWHPRRVPCWRDWGLQT